MSFPLDGFRLRIAILTLLLLGISRSALQAEIIPLSDDFKDEDGNDWFLNDDDPGSLGLDASFARLGSGNELRYQSGSIELTAFAARLTPFTLVKYGDPSFSGRDTELQDRSGIASRAEGQRDVLLFHYETGKFVSEDGAFAGSPPLSFNPLPIGGEADGPDLGDRVDDRSDDCQVVGVTAIFEPSSLLSLKSLAVGSLLLRRWHG